MKQRRILFLASATLVLLIGPAATTRADDCATLVTKFSDLADASKIQDCLRTGSNWGRVLGTVTGLVGAGVGAAGLGGKRGLHDPEYPPDPKTNDPCEYAAAQGRRIKKILGEKEKFEAQILQEWKTYGRLAEGLALQYRMIKENEYLVRSGYHLLKLKQGSKLTLAIYSCVTGLRAIHAATAARAAAAGAAPVAAAAPTLWSTTPQLSWLLSEIKDFADPGKLKDYYEFFTGTAEVQDLWKELMKAAAAYQKQAHAFNDSFMEWARGRQADLDNMYKSMNEELTRTQGNMRAALAQCQEKSQDEVEMPDSTIAHFDIPVLQAWTNLGYGWTVVGYTWGQITG